MAVAVLGCSHAGATQDDRESETEHESETVMRKTLTMQLFLLGALWRKPLPSSLEHRTSMIHMLHWNTETLRRARDI